jgi:hypothetical protein
MRKALVPGPFQRPAQIRGPGGEQPGSSACLPGCSFSGWQFCTSQARQPTAVPAEKAFTSHPRPRPENLQVVLVVHHAEDVPEWVDHGCGDESGSALDRLLVHRGAHGHQPLEADLDIVHVPVDHLADRYTSGH